MSISSPLVDCRHRPDVASQRVGLTEGMACAKSLYFNLNNRKYSVHKICILMYFVFTPYCVYERVLCPVQRLVAKKLIKMATLRNEDLY